MVEQTQMFKCWKCLREFENTDSLNIDYDRQDKENNWVCEDCQHSAFKGRYELIIDTHNNEQTALIINNYPYGFRLRTQIRYWIETTDRGDRFVSQTLNPKTNKWNNPKKSTYQAVMVLIKEKETGYIRSCGLYPTTDRTKILNFLGFIGGYELSKEQEEQIRILKAYSKTYENVTFKIREKTDDKLKEIIEDKQQQTATENIKKSVAYHYIKEDF
jgi:hypothetical protein